MRLILFGPPGCGKGTQAKLLCERLGLKHISTGDIIRDACSAGTPTGLLAKPYVVSGQLVPDALVIDLVNDCFRSADCPERFVMDGYPRTVPQAISFDQTLRDQALDLKAVIVLVVDSNEIVQRLSGRLTCSNCKETYQVTSKPPKKPGICDKCGTTLIQRADDKEATIRERLQVYNRNTEPLIGHYRAQKLVSEVPGSGGIENIYANIVQTLNLRARPPC